MTSVAERPLATGDSALALLARLFVEHAGRPGLAVFELPAPVVPATRLFATDPERALLWAAADEETAAVGELAVLEAAGDARFAAIRDQASALFGSLAWVGRSGAESRGRERVFAPRLFGGFAFQPGGADREPWSGFGDARFVLPRFRYTRAGGEARLTLAVRGGEIASGSARDAWLDAVAVRLDALERPLPPPGPVAAPRLADNDAAAAARWRARIEDILAGIAAGRFEKVVAARRVVAELGGALAPHHVTDALSRDYPACTRFAFRRGPRVFVGATPERLIEKHGLALRTEALAGSIGRDRALRASAPPELHARERADRGLELLASAKNRGEHAFVVRQVVDALAPLCAALDFPAEPEIRGLSNVMHLRTPITGTLGAPRHLLDLAERLHPTPAVGGTPTAAALDWIATREPDPRGWYAGPVGWFDTGGDGELVVALRSGLLDGARAHLYAGAGIVRDSDPDAEHAETRLKLAALLSALEAR